MKYTLHEISMIRNIAEMILRDLKFFKRSINKEEVLTLYPGMDEFIEYAYSKECSRSTVRQKISEIKDDSVRAIVEQAAARIYDIKIDSTLLDLKDECNRVQSKVRELNNALIGRKVVIKSNYNGQAYGKSKKSLKGKTATIRYFYVEKDANGEYYFGLFLEEYLVGIQWKDVELVDDK